MTEILSRHVLPKRSTYRQVNLAGTYIESIYEFHLWLVDIDNDVP